MAGRSSQASRRRGTTGSRGGYSRARSTTVGSPLDVLGRLIVLFGFVGTQLAWTLRPFFGSPGQPFGLFRHLSGTFYGDILQTIGHLLGGD